jgi:hypothetical protein
MEKFGYILSEAPAYILLVWFTVRFVQFRRWRNNRPIVTAEDQRLLQSRPRVPRNSFEFYLRFVVAVLAVTAIGFLEIVVLAPFGAAILSAALLLTTVALVRTILLFEP